MNEIIPGASAILVNSEGKVLMQLRDDKPGLQFANTWSLPGGHSEPGEDPAETLRRELLEEMEIDPPVRFWRRYQAQREGYIIDLSVFVGEFDRPAAEIPLHEGQALRYFGPGELESIVIGFDHRALLADYFRHTE